MAVSRAFGSRKPVKDHLTRGGGYVGEVRDLRKDTEAAFLVIEGGDFVLADGFYLNVLPVQSDRVTILASGNSSINVPLDSPFLYALTVEINLKNATAGQHYVYRNQIEVYRDGAGAVLHFAPAAPLTEAPSGGFGVYSVVLAVAGNNVTVQVNNGSANSVNVARYIGYSRKPMP
jgi:hypothetical protein